ncbi:ORF13 [Halorubrum pleomorphic virus 2]|uniref:ORF13 n=1 Tax=Halorubrum pleomorphic virus 2 TaxID=1156719 RepID=H9ABM7_9VIRU|nr:ORF13 [Halorubrum pleomorphic virus 2]AFD03997.1 ORF13 [Halorubrum pleomorphic virus 2]
MLGDLSSLAPACRSGLPASRSSLLDDTLRLASLVVSSTDLVRGLPGFRAVSLAPPISCASVVRQQLARRVSLGLRFSTTCVSFARRPPAFGRRRVGSQRAGRFRRATDVLPRRAGRRSAGWLSRASIG